jgi:hypothetical protein
MFRYSVTVGGNNFHKKNTTADAKIDKIIGSAVPVRTIVPV